jgi:putative addiction module killer protein
MNIKEKEIVLFKDEKGKIPFGDWIARIKDKKVKAIIFNRIDRINLGNFGDCKSVGGGVFELRIHFAAGFRVYFGKVNNQIILLLCGGDKRTQKQDISNALKYWKEFKKNEKEI